MIAFTIALWVFLLAAFAAASCVINGTFKRKPKPGEVWEFRRDGDPFGGGHTATILDVRAGWVRYDMGEYFRDQRMKMSSFTYCYQPPQEGT